MQKPLEIKNLNFYYGKNHILKNINLEIKNEKFITIVGPNGSGKSTLIKCIAKILKIKNNKIFVFGNDINKIDFKEYAKSVSYVPQLYNFDFNFNVLDIVLLGRNPYLNFYNKLSELDYEISYNALETIECTNLIDKKINTLSGGERQKVFIAKTLAQNTDILLLDEPISSLDIYNQIEIIDVLKKLAGQNKLIITVLHDLNMAIKYSELIIILKKGKIFKIGKPEEILKKDIIKECFNINIDILDGKYIMPISKIN